MRSQVLCEPACSFTTTPGRTPNGIPKYQSYVTPGPGSTGRYLTPIENSKPPLVEKKSYSKKKKATLKTNATLKGSQDLVFSTTEKILPEKNNYTKKQNVLLRLKINHAFAQSRLVVQVGSEHAKTQCLIWFRFPGYGDPNDPPWCFLKKHWFKKSKDHHLASVTSSPCASFQKGSHLNMIRSLNQTETASQTGTTVDGSEFLHQLSLVVYLIIYGVLYIPGGCLGFLPSTVTQTSLEIEILPGLPFTPKKAFAAFSDHPKFTEVAKPKMEGHWSHPNKTKTSILNPQQDESLTRQRKGLR